MPEVSIDLEAEREESRERRQLEQDEHHAGRIARELWTQEIKSVEHQARLISDAIAKRAVVSNYDAPRMRRLRKLIIEELDERREEAGRPQTRRMVVATDPPEEETPMERNVLNKSVRDIPKLPAAAQVRLQEHGIHTVGDLIEHSEEQLLEIPYVSDVAIRRIREFGLELADPEPVQNPEKNRHTPEPEEEEGGLEDPEDARVLRLEQGGGLDDEDTDPELPLHDELHLHGPWGRFCMVRDGHPDDGEREVMVDLHGRVSVEAADQLAALILAYKYEITVL